MDYSKLLFALEVSKLAIAMSNNEMPDNLTDEEEAAYIRANFRPNLVRALEDVEHVVSLIDEHRPQKN